jgi:lysyl-tRNA synthetase class 2
MAALDEIRAARIEKLEKLKKAGMNPYPARVPRDYSLALLTERFAALTESKTLLSVTGRITAIRGQGAIVFVMLDDGTAKFQAVFKKDDIEEKLFALFADTTDLGDFISVTGMLFTTERGQNSILVKTWTMASKSLLPLPSEYYGIEDEEELLRKRYLAFVLNPELRDLFYKKAKFWEATREYLKSNGFLDVETPTLEVTTGGAEARPFATHHNDFDMSVFMRISVGELWQKRLLAAGFPKTFEIGRVYRNEGTSPEHLQEFTNMEFYAAYMDYQEGILFTEEMIKSVVQETFGTLQFTTRGHTFDLSGTWERISYVDTVKNKTGVDVLKASEEEMKAKLDELKVTYEGTNRERLMDTLWKYCRKQISGPAWLIDVPKLVSPLSKAKPENPMLTERVQLILAGAECTNGFSELNDPIDQRERFEVQKKLIEGGDEEAMMPDWEFVEMLEHGMPPAFGFAYGERLFAFLVDKPLRETQLFPLMRPKEEGKKDKKKETKIAVAVINKGAGLLLWQEMNTVAHLNAAFGARVGKELFTKDTISSKDGVSIKLNTKQAIMIKTARSSKELQMLAEKAKKVKLEVDEFTREMIETTNDKKVIENTAAKNYDEVEYLGVLVYGSKKEVEELTKDYQLYK